MFRTPRSVNPQTATEQSAYDRWLDQNAQRQQERVARVKGAEGIMPLPVWFALYSIAGVILVHMLFFADPGEGAITQVLMGGATIRMAPGWARCSPPPCNDPSDSWLLRWT
jgi:hypothetical protein